MNGLLEKHGFGKQLDHGELSIPNRTKNIDAEIDSYKKDKAVTDKRDHQDRLFLGAQSHKENKEIASELYKKHGTAMVKKYKEVLEAQGFKARDFIRDEANHSPSNFIRLVDGFLREQGDE